MKCSGQAPDRGQSGRPAIGDIRRDFTRQDFLGHAVGLGEFSFQAAVTPAMQTRELARRFGWDDRQIVVNVQGDEPLIDPSTIGGVVAALTRDPSLQMASSCVALTDRGDHTNPNVVKVVRNLSGDALYFSRAPIPHLRGSGSGRAPVFKHLGLYAYRRAFLLAFAALPQTPLEVSESLEQLRALEHGHRIHLVETPFDSIGVDTPDDLERVRQHISATARA